MPRQFLAYKVDIYPMSTQRFSQCQTSHNMARTDLDRGISSENDIHLCHLSQALMGNVGAPDALFF
jgi:hypothetical protein